MSFKDWTRGLVEKAKQGGLFGGGEAGQESNMANGGFSGYRPAQQAKAKEARDTQSIPVMPQEGAPGFDAHTGFTGMFPPVDGAPQGMGGTSAYPPASGTAAYPPMGGTAAYPPAGGYAQPWQGATSQMPPQQSPWQGGATGQMPYGQPTPYETQQHAPQPNTAYHTGMTGRQQPVGGGMAGTGRYQPVGASQQPPDNIRYMPGSFVGDDGKAYTHVERVAQLVSVSACYRIIEFMRNRESVIVNTESIASDGEIQRCMDMLSGAAFTLGCSITKITQVKRAYLIAPANVLVMPDMVFQRMSDREGGRWRQDDVQEPRRDDRAYRGDYGPRETEQRPSHQDYAAGYQQMQEPYAQPARASDGYGRSAGYESQQAPQGFGGFGGFGTSGFGQ